MTDYRAQVTAYEKFKQEKLLPELHYYQQEILKIRDQIREYESLMGKLEELEVFRENNRPEEPFKVDLPLSTDLTAQIDVHDKDYIYVSVGFGFYPQLTGIEARDFCVAKIEQLRRTRLERYEGKLERMEEHLSLTEQVIKELNDSMAKEKL